MDAPSSSIVAAAREQWAVTDTHGRRLVLRRLDALGKLKLFKALGPALSQNEPYLGMALLAASVAAIDGIPSPLPSSEGAIENVVQRLGDVGLAAVALALRPEERSTWTAQKTERAPRSDRAFVFGQERGAVGRGVQPLEYRAAGLDCRDRHARRAGIRLGKPGPGNNRRFDAAKLSPPTPLQLRSAAATTGKRLMPEAPLDLYEDVVVIPFEIPWRLGHSGGEEGRTDQPEPDNAPGVSPVEPMQVGRSPDLAPVSSQPTEGRLVMARVQGQPSLAISGMSDGELTLWRLRGETSPAEAVSALKLDLEGALWDSRGQFVGLLWPNETALLHPDWLRSIGAGVASPSKQKEISVKHHSEPRAGWHNAPGAVLDDSGSSKWRAVADAGGGSEARESPMREAQELLLTPRVPFLFEEPPEEITPPDMERSPHQSGKESADDIPSWAKGEKRRVGETPREFAKRLMDEKYGEEKWKRSSPEFRKIKKFGERAFRNPIPKPTD